jgi:hypothetical protein
MIERCVYSSSGHHLFFVSRPHAPTENMIPNITKRFQSLSLSVYLYLITFANKNVNLIIKRFINLSATANNSDISWNNRTDKIKHSSIVFPVNFSSRFSYFPNNNQTIPSFSPYVTHFLVFRLQTRNTTHMMNDIIEHNHNFGLYTFFCSKPRVLSSWNHSFTTPKTTRMTWSNNIPLSGPNYRFPSTLFLASTEQFRQRVTQHDEWHNRTF